MKTKYQKKSFLTIFIIFLIGIIIGIIIVKNVKNTAKTECVEPIPVIKTTLLTDLNSKEQLYENISLNEKVLIISNKTELEKTLKTYTEDNIQNSNALKKIRENYSNFNFEKKQLLFVDISTSSGCDYLKILNITLTQTYININLEPQKQYQATCQIVLEGIRIVEIEKGNYTNININ